MSDIDQDAVRKILSCGNFQIVKTFLAGQELATLAEEILAVVEERALTPELEKFWRKRIIERANKVLEEVKELAFDLEVDWLSREFSALLYQERETGEKDCLSGAAKGILEAERIDFTLDFASSTEEFEFLIEVGEEEDLKDFLRLALDVFFAVMRDLGNLVGAESGLV